MLALLQRDRRLDRQQGYTRHGPQRADFILRLQGRSVSESLSRGQQKLLVAALILAQARLFHARRETACTLLIDDLPAELDAPSRARIMQCLAEQPVQLLITAIEPNLLDAVAWSDYRVFRLQHGNVQEDHNVV